MTSNTFIKAGEQVMGNDIEDEFQGTNENPFLLPSDQDVFLMRVQERQEKRTKREEWRNMKIWEKTQKTAVVRAPRRALLSPHKMKQQRSTILGERRREKENMADFIAKKREMFLVQMSLDTKRDEIRKLEERAQMKEQALLKSELMLEEDALRFDAFLKENDVKAHEAIKKHEKEVKEKQEKTTQIKRLNQEIAKVKSEMDKYSEALEYCRKYKAFLDKLTAKEWFDEQTRKREENKQLIEQYEKNNAKRQKRNRERQLRRNNGEEDVETNSPTPTPPPPEAYDEEEEMFFKTPEQLLEVFAALEERNLFLIQNAQETEEAFDELKQKFEETQAEMEAKTRELESNIQEMNAKIAVQEKKASGLRERAKALGASGDNQQQKLLDELGAKVSKVFADCGFDPEQTPDTLSKLAKIEELLEDLIIRLDEMPENERRKAEKRKEAERRDRLRREKVMKTEREYEERLKRSLERALRVEERVKQQRRGKPNMFRSAPVRKKKKKQTAVDNQKEEEERLFRKFFS